MFDGLERNINLKNLILSKNDISDVSIKYLCKRLTDGMNIKYLDLSHNYISPKSGIPLMESLGLNDSITTLIINNNSLGDESAQELVQTLKKTNKVLRKINLENNAIAIRFIEEINDFLVKNEILAIQRVLPDYRREIRSMANDKREYNITCDELLNCIINKSSTLTRAK